MDLEVRLVKEGRYRLAFNSPEDYIVQSIREATPGDPLSSLKPFLPASLFGPVGCCGFRTLAFWAMGLGCRL